VGAQIIFPESGCGLGHVTPIIFGIPSNMNESAVWQYGRLS